MQAKQPSLKCLGNQQIIWYICFEFAIEFEPTVSWPLTHDVDPTQENAFLLLKINMNFYMLILTCNNSLSCVSNYILFPEKNYFHIKNHVTCAHEYRSTFQSRNNHVLESQYRCMPCSITFTPHVREGNVIVTPGFLAASVLQTCM